jgi:hypothetical protein
MWKPMDHNVIERSELSIKCCKGSSPRSLRYMYDLAKTLSCYIRLVWKEPVSLEPLRSMLTFRPNRSLSLHMKILSQ